MIHWLQAHHPPAERRRVWLIFRDAWRHAQWYAPEFELSSVAEVRSVEGRTLDGKLSSFSAVYTDDPEFGRPPEGCRLVATFSRSPLIYRKHNVVQLYRSETGPR